LANGFFSEEKLAEIRDRSSILEIVSDYVTLKKTGKNHRGLCPFHSEKTPSFMVNEEKQIFHCFGCGEGGDVFAFLMKAGNFTFPQAAEELARRYGVKLPSQDLSPSQKKEMAERETLFQINEIASNYFYDLLMRRGEGEEGRTYLAQRGISEEVISAHRVGYSTDRWDGLVRHLQEKKVSLELAAKLGLIFPKKRGEDSTQREGRRAGPAGWYDAFRGRILFPIFDVHQRIVGFGGRVIRQGQPKYLNSPESSLYHKGEILYGLHVAKRSIPEKDCVILVEGYFDLLTLHQYGLKHSVATSGTALTVQHVHTLKRYTKNIITVFDADPAGIQATLRSLPLFIEEGITGRTIALPEGEDPDGYLRKRGLEDFEKKIAGSVSLMDFFFDALMRRHDVKSIDGRISAAEEGAALVGKISDQIRRDFYLKALAERLDLQESSVREMLRSSSHPPRKGQVDLRQRLVDKDFPKSEQMVVRIMAHRPELVPVVSEERILREFESPILQKLGEELVALYQKKGKLDVAQILGSLEGDLQRRLREFLFQSDGLEGGLHEEILKDCIDKIRGSRLKKDEKELLRRIQESEERRGGEGLEALLTERQKLARREKGSWKGGLRKG